MMHMPQFEVAFWAVLSYVGLDGVYTHTVAYERDPACQICSPSVPFEVASTDTLQQVTPLA